MAGDRLSTVDLEAFFVSGRWQESYCYEVEDAVRRRDLTPTALRSIIESDVDRNRFLTAKAVKHRNMTTELVALALRIDDVWLRSLTVESRQASSELLATVLVDSEHVLVRRAAVRNANATAVQIEPFVTDPDAQIRAGVARNVNASRSQLARLRRDPKSAVRAAVAMHRNADPAWIASARFDRDAHVRARSLMNPATTLEELEAAERHDPAPTVRSAARKHSLVPAAWKPWVSAGWTLAATRVIVTSGAFGGPISARSVEGLLVLAEIGRSPDEASWI